MGTYLLLRRGASWALKKILSCRAIVDSLGGWNRLLKHGKYSIQATYTLLRPRAPKVSWRKLICHNSASPKSVFITWLALHGRLPTCDRVVKWIPNISVLRPMCKMCNETMQHLFFESSFSASVWSRLLTMMQIQRPVENWMSELRKAIWSCNRSSPRALLYVAAFTKTVYEV